MLLLIETSLTVDQINSKIWFESSLEMLKTNVMNLCDNFSIFETYCHCF